MSFFACLQEDEQLLIQNFSSREVRNGPGVVFYKPVVCSVQKRKATLLEELEYTVVTDTLTGVQRSEGGPQLLFLGAYDEASSKRRKIILQKDEYVKVLDSKTGNVRIVQGPAVFAPRPTESIPEGTSKAVSLRKHEFVRLTDTARGAMRVERGEQLVFPTAMEVMEPKGATFQLKRNEYVRLIDRATGVIRVEVGEQIVFPTPTEEALEEVKEAVNVDDETAVLAVNNESGQQRLVTQKGLFFPGPLDEILEVRKLIHVEPHEVAIVRDNQGTFTFHNGGAKGGQGTAFFLPPHCELVTMHWSSGTSEEDLQKNVVRNAKRPVHKVPVTKIDLRAQYASFEYSVRTSDNVELVLEGTIFWQVTDVPQMIRTTGDPKGDVWYHARSALIQAVARVTLEGFMAKFSEIVTTATSVDDAFYKERGVMVHNVEVTRYECVDAKTSAVLQEIIQETTNRINRMQQQQSENDVLKEQLKGETELEQKRKELIQAKSDNDRMKAIIEGEADGLRLAKNVQSFLATLDKDLPDADVRLALLKFFEEQQMSTKRAEHLASGKATVFLTPQDMNLKLNMSKL
jgi:regulator of protease activity HflC (stomatin/prohibitin superfamily)